MSDGCKLVDSNRTHSICACTHLTTFGLLTSSDDLLHAHHQESPTLQERERDQQQQQQPAAKVQLESVESGILLPVGQQSADYSSPSSSSPSSPGYKLLYLIKVSQRCNSNTAETSRPKEMIDLCRRPLVRSFVRSLVGPVRSLVCIH